MTGAALRQHLRQRRKALRLRLKERQQLSRERLAANPAIREARARRRRRRLLTVLTILLAILFVSRCDCSEAGAPAPVVEPPAPVAVPPPKVEPKPRPKAKPEIHQGAVSVPRPAFDGERRPPPAWLDAFRLQVAARGPRLAQCFAGAEKPGALRWTASVNAGSGAVSDHLLEPLGASAGLLEKQRACVAGVLSTPAYRLGKAEQALPERVSIAVEF